MLFVIAQALWMAFKEAAEPGTVQVKVTQVLQFIFPMFRLFLPHYPSVQNMWLSRCTCVTRSGDAVYQSSILTA